MASFMAFGWSKILWRNPKTLEFPGGLVVQDLVLSLLWFGSLLWCVQSPALELLPAMGTAKKQNKSKKPKLLKTRIGFWLSLPFTVQSWFHEHFFLLAPGLQELEVPRRGKFKRLVLRTVSRAPYSSLRSSKMDCFLGVGGSKFICHTSYPLFHCHWINSPSC